MIDQRYLEVKPNIYYRDYFIPALLFPVFFSLAYLTEDWYFVVYAAASSICLHRLVAFVHELCHRRNNERLQRFRLLWDLTVGAIILFPTARFFRSHLVHHRLGIFGTRDDPQYILLRSNPSHFILVIVIAPLLLPFFLFVPALSTALFPGKLETWWDDHLRSKGLPISHSEVLEPYQNEVTWLSRYSIVLWIIYAMVLPSTLPLFYAVLVGMWYLITTRMPFEHRLRAHQQQPSTRHDQIVDSFTIESPTAALLQPLGMRYHAAHHMYPGVPYHNLPELHRTLKRDNAAYRESMASFFSAMMGLPNRPYPNPQVANSCTTARPACVTRTGTR